MKYEINRGTLALVPNNLEGSFIYEDEESYTIFCVLKKIVFCKQNSIQAVC